MSKRVSVIEAAAILGASPQYVRIGLQQGALKIGSAVKMSSSWTYNIQADKLSEAVGHDVEDELRRLRSAVNYG